MLSAARVVVGAILLFAIACVVYVFFDGRGSGRNIDPGIADYEHLDLPSSDDEISRLKADLAAARAELAAKSASCSGNQSVASTPPTQPIPSNTTGVEFASAGPLITKMAALKGSIPMNLPLWVFNPTASQKQPARKGPNTFPETAFRSSSQYGEDLYLVENFFWEMQEGTYLEIGALNGYWLSNTFSLESQMKWKGVLVEAMPTNYQKLAKNRSDNACFNFAACGDPRVVHVTALPGSVSGIVEFMTPSFAARWYGPRKHDWFAKPPRYIDTDPLACVPLSIALDVAGFRHINFFSLDVEGAELAVASSLDFNKYTFDVIATECDGHNKTKNQLLVDLITSKGFDYHAVSFNCWFVRKGFVPSVAPAGKRNPIPSPGTKK